jgi:hypothetical protein
MEYLFLAYLGDTPYFFGAYSGLLEEAQKGLCLPIIANHQKSEG